MKPLLARHTVALRLLRVVPLRLFGVAVFAHRRRRDRSAMAIEAVADLKKTGVNTVKFFVTPDELLPWCLVHNKPNNAASRAEFVSERLRSQSDAGA